MNRQVSGDFFQGLDSQAGLLVPLSYAYQCDLPLSLGHSSNALFTLPHASGAAQKCNRPPNLDSGQHDGLSPQALGRTKCVLCPELLFSVCLAAAFPVWT